MANWKNLFNDPPKDDCNVCVKVGDNFETYQFRRHSANAWGIYKYQRLIEPAKISANAEYINLDEIK